MESAVKVRKKISALLVDQTPAHEQHSQPLPHWECTHPVLRRRLLALLWPLAIGVMIHRIVIDAVNGHYTNDFLPVYNALRAFLSHAPVYTDNVDFTNPHYLYAPSATLLLSPFGVWGSFTVNRWIFIGANALCIIAALIWLLRIVGYRPTSPLLPAVLLAAFFTEGISNTLIFSNINGFIFLCEVAFLWCLIEGRWWWAGVPMGLACAIKPILLPLLLLPVLLHKFQPLVAACGIPVILTAIAWPLSADPEQYFLSTSPYLGTVRDYYNNAIAGWFAYWGLPVWVAWFARILVIILGITALLLLQAYRTLDLTLWALTSSGICLLIAFLAGSLGQRYYSIMLLPLVASILLRPAFLRVFPAWMAIYLILDGSSWYSRRWYMYGRWIEYSRATVGWTLLLVTITVALVWRTAVARRLKDPTFPSGWRAYL